MLGERKQHPGMYKQNHSPQHMWSNVLALHRMSKAKLYPILHTSGKLYGGS